MAARTEPQRAASNSDAMIIELNADENAAINFEIRILFLSFMLHFLTQVNSLDCPWSEKWQRLISIVFSMIPWLWPSISPKSYLKHRTNFLVVFRVIYFAFPLLRKARGIQRVLDSPATPGILGFMLDILKIAWGSRLFAIVYAAFSMPLPIELNIPLQLYSIYMILSNNTLCSSTLCADPLSTSRFQGIIYFVTALLLPVSAMPLITLVNVNNYCTVILVAMHIVFGVFATSIPVLKMSLYNRQYKFLAHYFSKNKTEAVIAWWVTLQLVWSISIVLAKIQDSA